MRGTGDGDLKKSVPMFARGLAILLVDHDLASRTSISSMLQRYSFNVTATQSTTKAMSLIRDSPDRDHKGPFKLVMAHLSLKKRENLSFLRALVEKGLPVILISSDKNFNDAERALAEGARLFLEQPISLSDLKHIWQHAYQRRTNNSTEEDAQVGIKRKRNRNKEISMVAEESHSKNVPEPLKDRQEGRKAEVNSSHKEMKRPVDDENDHGVTLNKKVNIGAERVDSGKHIVPEEAKEINENGQSALQKKSRTVWTSELHLKFTAALSILGDNSARPKSILQMMNVPHLTQRQVASHLQKFKAQVQQIGLAGAARLASSNTQMEDPPAMDGTLGTDIFAFGRRSNSTQYLPPSNPFLYQEFDNFLYQDLQRMNDLINPEEPSNPNHTPSYYENSALALIGRGYNSEGGDVSEKQCVSEAEGTKIQSPKMDMTSISSPLEVGEDTDNFSDLTSILGTDQLSTTFNMDFRPRYGLSAMNTEKISSLPAVNSTQNETDCPPCLASALRPLQPTLTGTGICKETSPGHSMNLSSSTNCSDFLMAFKDENPVENTATCDELLKVFEEEPYGFTFLDCKLNLDDENQYSEWLEELLQAPNEGENNLFQIRSPKP